MNLFSETAEQAVIGAMLKDPSLIDDILEIVQPDDFLIPVNQAIMKASVLLSNEQKNIDVITLTERLIHSHDGILELLADLATGVASKTNIKAYSQAVKDFSLKRNLYYAAQEVLTMLNQNPDLDAEKAVNGAQTLFSNFENSLEEKFEIKNINQSLKGYVAELDRRFERGDELNGWSTGLNAIDAILDGLKQQHLVVIAGRPSMGKSTYGLQIAGHASIHEKLTGIYFSLEMGGNELTEKLIACFGRINLEFLKNPKKNATEEIWPKLQNAACKIKDSNLHIADCPGMHINQLKTYARKFHRKNKLDFIVVDHINIMSGDGESETLRIGSVSKGLKQLAKELNITSIALSQLNRKVEDRANKRPVLSDLRGSGSIEEDADAVQFVYRDDYYNDSPDNPNKGLVEIVTAKHRGGKLGESVLENCYHQSRLEDTDRIVQYGPPPTHYKKPNF